MYLEVTVLFLVDFRLRNQTNNAGILEVRWNNVWAPLQGSRDVSYLQSAYLEHYCKELGIRSSAPSFNLDDGGEPNDNTSWKPRECYLSRCRYIYLRCEDAKFKVSNTYAVDGAILVLEDGNWYPFCINHRLTEYEAALLCRAVGLPSLNASDVSRRQQTSSTNVRLLIRCGTHESSIGECISSANRTMNTCRGDLVGVRCDTSSVRFRLQTEPGDILQVNVGGRWGSLCDPMQNMTVNEAKVICRQMNMTSKFAVPIFVPEDREITLWHLPMWTFPMKCDRTANSLDECAGAVQSRSCNRNEVAALTCTDRAPVYRLVAGKDDRSGRVEIQFNGVWGAVCSVNFGLNEAKAVCRSMGYNSSGANYGRGIFGSSTAPVLLKDLACAGDETSLDQCPGFRWRSPLQCNRNHDIGVTCKYAQEGQLQLVGGFDKVSGRLEVYHSGSWGSVCVNGFGDHEARVACKQITNAAGLAKRINSQGSLPLETANDIVLAVRCRGDQTRLVDCRSKPWGEHDCSDDGAVYLSCDLASTGYRLFGGNSTFGLLQVYHDNEWGTICNRGFTKEQAKIVCRYLDLSSGLAAATSGHIASNGYRIWLGTTNCKDSAITSCFVHEWGNPAASCTHDNDLEISCEHIDYEAVRYRLGQFNAINAGRVEMYYKGQWGTICDTDFQDVDAKVACSSMGLPIINPKVLQHRGYVRDDMLEKVWMSQVNCFGTEMSLLHCPFQELGVVRMCGHGDDIAITCGDSTDTDYPLRLMGSSEPNSGRLEVQINGVWGTICGRNFDQQDVNVACRKLGLPTSNVRLDTITKYGQGSGLIWLSAVACYGWETSLGDCLHDDVANTCDDHSLDVAIICEDRDMKDNTGYIAAGVVVGIVAVVIIIGVCLVRRRHKRMNNAARVPESASYQMQRSPAPSAPAGDVVQLSLVDRSSIPETPPFPPPSAPGEPDVFLDPPPSYTDLFPDAEPKPGGTGNRYADISVSYT